MSFYDPEFYDDDANDWESIIDEELDNEPDPEMEFGCHFPDRCLMPGIHLRCECHTAEMIRDYYYG